MDFNINISFWSCLNNPQTSLFLLFLCMLNRVPHFMAKQIHWPYVMWKSERNSKLSESRLKFKYSLKMFFFFFCNFPSCFFFIATLVLKEYQWAELLGMATCFDISLLYKCANSGIQVMQVPVQSDHCCGAQTKVTQTQPTTASTALVWVHDNVPLNGPGTDVIVSYGGEGSDWDATLSHWLACSLDVWRSSFSPLRSERRGACYSIC